MYTDKNMADEINKISKLAACYGLMVMDKTKMFLPFFLLGGSVPLSSILEPITDLGCR